MKNALLTLMILPFIAIANGGASMDSFIEQQINKANQLFNDEFGSHKQTTVKLAEKVIWRDTALGCPKEGIDSRQVLTDGIRIVLTFNDKDYNYHGDSKGNLFLCRDERAQLPYRSGWQSAEY